MARLFKRHVRVWVGGQEIIGGRAQRLDLQVSELMIAFSINRKADSTPAQGEVAIYNLNESHETLIRDRGRSLILEAGYLGARFGLLVSGDIRRVDKDRNGLDRILRMQVGGHIRQRTEAFVSAAYEGEVSVRTIVSDIVQQGFPGFPIEPISLIPADEVEEDYVLNGQAGKALNQLLRPLRLSWFDDNGVIRITKEFVSSAQQAGGTIVVSELSGLVGSPTITSEGVRAKTLLDHRINLDSQVRVESEVLNFAASGDAANARAIEGSSGDWKVVALNHAGDNRSGGFSTEMELRPL